MPPDALLQPYPLKNLTLRNRIVSTAHEPAYVENGMPGERYRLYQREKALGGVGLTLMGGSAVVAADSPGVFGNIDMSRDEVVDYLRPIANDCHDAGAALMIQLTHLGQRSSSYKGDWLPLISPSRSREPAHRSFTRAMDEADIDRVVSSFADAASRAADAGLDGIELYHSGHLLDAFLSDRWNQRDDEYGGSLQNRMRFPLRVIDAVRSAVPDDFILALRMSVDEQRADGLGMTEDRAIEVVSTYAQHGVDLLDVLTGSIESDSSLARHIPGMGTPSAPGLETCRRIRNQVDIPVLHATRIADLPTARHAIADGCTDLIGMTRAHLADPHLVRKLTEKREDDIRPCVGANVCLDAIYTSGSAVCIHNPATGRERTLPHRLPPSDSPLRLTVIGAGPAGLEAARVGARRGHAVTVLEADSTYGGQVRCATRSERRRDLAGVIDWRYQQATKHGAQFRFNTLAEPEDILAEQPDVVIVATGGIPDTEYGDGWRTAATGEGLPGSVPVFDVLDVMQGALARFPHVLVYDDHGQYPALDAVEYLARNGQKASYVSPERTIGIDVGSMNSPAYLTAFSDYGVETVLNERLIRTARADDGRVTATLRNEYSGNDTVLSVDAVVVDHGAVPNDEIYQVLRDQSANRGVTDPEAFVAGKPQPTFPTEGGFRLYRIGDAVTSRTIHAAILDALRTGLGI